MVLGLVFQLQRIYRSKGPDLGYLRILRGGSSADDDADLGCGHRQFLYPNYPVDTLGFHIVYRQ